jgi:hypothetical protein
MLTPLGVSNSGKEKKGSEIHAKKRNQSSSASKFK